jgi:hypothetical protein
MFGRRRHVAPTVSAPAPQLTENDIFDIVHAQIAAAIGDHGEWTLTRRVDSDTDSLFHGVVAHSVTTHVVEALREAREALSRVPAPAEVADRLGEHVAGAATQTPEVAPAEVEPIAFGWQPAPITIWTDLKKPVTGQLAQIHHDRHQLVA